VDMTKLKVRLTFTEPVLGTRPGNPELLQKYILDKARKKHPDLPPEMEEEELIAMPAVEEAVDEKSTFFSRDEEGNPILWDFMFKGLFKEACWALRRVPKTASGKLKAYIKEIHGLIFVFPRKIKLELPEGTSPEIYERPLRGQTPKGERVSIARSEMLPAGTTCEFEVRTLSIDMMDAIDEWLQYGALKGMCQFRTGSFGRFTYELLN